ncbi:hypothetical protein [Olivibacter sp. XZL3]|uniref:hypothetical protein n=1 Tax=Olivibacter sp. XZL3 TaxID=1735116 RepID=UPI001066E298|nr:hypothetical protein [Olivibacter sp. XZL3]
MNTKTIFIIILTVLVTIILMKNTDEVIFWIFGDRYIPKLAILGSMFAFGIVVGFLLGRPRKKNELSTSSETFQTSDDQSKVQELTDPYRSNLSEDDRKYLD